MSLKDPEARRAYYAKWSRENREKKLLGAAKWRAAHRKEMLAYGMAYRAQQRAEYLKDTLEWSGVQIDDDVIW